MKLSTRSTGKRMLVSLSPNVFQPVVWFKKLCLFSCIRGRLLEVNETILETPSLVLQKVKTYTQHLHVVIITVFTTKHAVLLLLSFAYSVCQTCTAVHWWIHRCHSSKIWGEQEHHREPSEQGRVWKGSCQTSRFIAAYWLQTASFRSPDWRKTENWGKYLIFFPPITTIKIPGCYRKNSSASDNYTPLRTLKASKTIYN